MPTRILAKQHGLSVEDVHAELAKPENERSEDGRLLTEALRQLKVEGELDDPVDYRHGVLRLKLDHKKRDTGASRRKRREPPI